MIRWCEAIHKSIWLADWNCAIVVSIKIAYHLITHAAFRNAFAYPLPAIHRFHFILFQKVPAYLHAHSIVQQVWLKIVYHVCINIMQPATAATATTNNKLNSCFSRKSAFCYVYSYFCCCCCCWFTFTLFAAVTYTLLFMYEYYRGLT